MTKLTIKPNLSHHDDLYERFVSLHEGLNAEESLKLHSKLILLLANHIGDENIVSEAIDIVAGNKRKDDINATN